MATDDDARKRKKRGRYSGKTLRQMRRKSQKQAAVVSAIAIYLGAPLWILASLFLKGRPMGSKGGGATAGYEYSFGIHMGISRGPINEIVEIRVGDKTAWSGSQIGPGTIAVNSPELFGGRKQEGGIVGPLQVMMGEETQVAPSGLVAMLGHALPGFRRMCTVFFNGIVATNSPYPKSWKFRVRRTDKGWQNDECWYPEKVKIELTGTRNVQQPDPDPNDDDEPDPIPEMGVIHAMNPAHIVYELFTNESWGRGLSPDALDLASFIDAANTLYDEKLGLCLNWTNRDSMQEFLQSVLDHIGGVVYSDRETSLLKLKLIRADYVAADLPIYDTDSGLLEIREAVSSTLGPAVNEVRVNYMDQLNAKQRTVSAQNLAALQATKGVFNPLTIDYPGVPTPELALRLAQRDLRANASSLRRYVLVMDRRAWRIPPAGVFRIRDPQRGLQDIVVRVGRIEDGTITDGKITITAVQDVFGFPETSFIAPEPPQWVKPNTVPELKRHRVFELPYFILNGYLTPADFAHVANDNGYVGTVAEKPTPLSLAYDLNVKNSHSTPDEIPT